MDISEVTPAFLFAWDWFAHGQNAIVLGIFLAGAANCIAVYALAKTAYELQREPDPRVLLNFDGFK
jgi:hypothetical protein